MFNADFRGKSPLIVTDLVNALTHGVEAMGKDYAAVLLEQIGDSGEFFVAKYFKARHSFSSIDYSVCWSKILRASLSVAKGTGFWLNAPCSGFISSTT